MQHCELCTGPGGDLLWANEECRVILVEGEEAGHYAGFCRVIWKAHVAEMSDLEPAQSTRLMRVVMATERAVRDTMMPDKINLASLGNVVPHLHWHVIARFESDSHFPAPIWAAARREATPMPAQLLADVDAAIAQALSA